MPPFSRRDSATARPAVPWSASVLRAIRGSVILGYGLALAGLFISFSGSDLSLGKTLLHGLAVFAVMVLPPTLALLAHPNRPLMLLPAGVVGVLGLYTLSILGFPLVLLGLIWLWAYSKVASPGRWQSKAAIILVPFLWLAAYAALWLHVDPVCEQRMEDGAVVEVDPAARGLESGWAWEMGSTSSSSGLISGEVVSEVCTSNAVVAWETMSAILLSGGAVLVAMWLAYRSTVPKTKV